MTRWWGRERKTTTRLERREAALWLAWGIVIGGLLVTALFVITPPPLSLERALRPAPKFLEQPEALREAVRENIRRRAFTRYGGPHFEDYEQHGSLLFVRVAQTPTPGLWEFRVYCYWWDARYQGWRFIDDWREGRHQRPHRP